MYMLNSRDNAKRDESYYSISHFLKDNTLLPEKSRGNATLLVPINSQRIDFHRVTKKEQNSKHELKNNLMKVKRATKKRLTRPLRYMRMGSV